MSDQDSDDAIGRLLQFNTVANIRAMRPAGYPLTIGRLAHYADSGLGATATTEGEMFAGEFIMINRATYEVRKDETTLPVFGNTPVCFAQAAEFLPLLVSSNICAADADDLAAQIRTHLDIAGLYSGCFVAKLYGHAEYLQARAVDGTDPKYHCLDAVVADQHRFEISGQRCDMFMVFSAPGVVSAYETFPGWHIHALAEDHRRGGHVLDLRGFAGPVAMMPVDPVNWFVALKPVDDHTLIARRVLTGDLDAAIDEAGGIEPYLERVKPDEYRIEL